MLTFMILCYIWFLQTFLICCDENPTVMRFSVPEDHQVCLRCGGPDRSHVVWTLQDRQVLVTREGSYETNKDRQRYLLQPDGGLCVLQLDDSDNGEYRCNQLLVAELQVLTGTDHDFMVSAGRTLLLPCSRSHKPKQRWFHQRKGGRREAIFTLFRNGTAKAEREGSRLSFKDKSLQIQDLQPEDAGEYQCNGKLQANVTVLTVQNEPTSIQISNSTPLTSAVGITDVVELKKKEKKRTENAVLMVAVVGLGLMILLMTAVCILLTSMKCRRKRKYRYEEAQRHEVTELQPWETSSNRPAEREVLESLSLPEETIHYASLGHQNWRERPSRTPPDQHPHHVIYSSVITRSAAK
ncbi:uncharacterized protein LOC111665674 isoform X1 [Seriola lalandi dorsalis]|uniref:uncharacterized protein LOC111665674 isoform X1 n=1 Tax=Seriola lalandi dorsalis TaxID=1841481 RepID=UPI000C6F61CA|nr:uncharacterized protein LOC111665674 isoform X1 [Seriola lalandi dorsalis]